MSGGGQPDAGPLADLDDLAGYLNALAHPNRLELLAQLQTPRTVREVHLRPSRNELTGNPDRVITRTAVEHHLLLLRAIGVVASRPSERDGRKVEEFVLQRARLFQVTERLRDLMRLRPVIDLGIDRTEQGHGAGRPIPAPRGPTLTILSGPDEGHAFTLPGDGRFTIGRSAESDAILDYDPYVSSNHCVIAREGSRFVLLDYPDARNGTLLNWTPLPRGATHLLVNGDVIKAGRTLMLFLDER